jgi:hypothetical protein
MRLLSAALAAVLFLPAAWAESIEAQGSAPLDAGVTAARQLAIQDALKQAALSRGAHLTSAQYVNAGQVSESSQLTATPLSGKVEVLDEQQKDGLYLVRIRVDVAPPVAAAQPVAAAAPVPNGAGCGDGGRSLRRRVVLAHFFVDEPAEAGDLDSLGMRLPHELATRLDSTGAAVLSARDAGTVSVLPDRFLRDPKQGAVYVRALAQAESAQFVVSGRVFSTAVTDRSVHGVAFGVPPSGEPGVAYTGPFADFLGARLAYRPSARQFDIEVWIYDGVTGSLLQLKRLSAVAHGDVQPERPIPFASAGFWSTDYGKTIDGVLNDAVQDVIGTIHCIPFSARVARVGSDGMIYLDAGGMDGLQVGDKLLLYRPRLPDALQSAPDGSTLGVPESLLGDVTVIQVQPNLAVAVSQDAKSPVESGDIVRFMPTR